MRSAYGIAMCARRGYGVSAEECVPPAEQTDFGLRYTSGVKKRILITAATFVVVGAFAQASTVSYDLTSQWQDNANPNGAFSYRQDGTLLPYQASFASLGGLALPGITSGFAPGHVVGDFLPLIGQATSNGGAGFDYLTGDVAFHTVDGANGNPALGQFNIDWTAPTSGSITISGELWYAQQSASRSNDFSLELVRAGSVISTFGTGTIAYNSLVGSNRSNPDQLSGGGSITVDAGDVVELLAQRTAGQTYGSVDGVELTIVESSQAVAPVPEPAYMTLVGLGVGALVLLKRKLT
jgi:hypothetical protein